jgi:hypothetical protein
MALKPAQAQADSARKCGAGKVRKPAAGSGESTRQLEAGGLERERQATARAADRRAMGVFFMAFLLF